MSDGKYVLRFKSGKARKAALQQLEFTQPPGTVQAGPGSAGRGSSTFQWNSLAQKYRNATHPSRFPRHASCLIWKTRRLRWRWMETNSRLWHYVSCFTEILPSTNLRVRTLTSLLLSPFWVDRLVFYFILNVTHHAKRSKSFFTHMESRSCAATMDRSPTHLPRFRGTTLRAIPGPGIRGQNHPPFSKSMKKRPFRKRETTPKIVDLQSPYLLAISYYLGWSSKNPKWMHQNHVLPHAPMELSGSGLLRLMVDSHGTLRAIFLAEPEVWPQGKNGTKGESCDPVGETRLLCMYMGVSKNRGKTPKMDGL